MSMICCTLCDAFIDSDEHPHGFYVKGYDDKYVCESCVQNDNLEYEI